MVPPIYYGLTGRNLASNYFADLRGEQYLSGRSLADVIETSCDVPFDISCVVVVVVLATMRFVNHLNCAFISAAKLLTNRMEIILTCLRLLVPKMSAKPMRKEGISMLTGQLTGHAYRSIYSGGRLKESIHKS